MIFLTGSIIFYFRTREEIEVSIFFGTDALTLYGLVVTFFTMLAIKIPIIKRLISQIYLNINISKLQYELSFIVNCNFNIEDFYKLFIKGVKSSDQFNDAQHEIYNREKYLIRFSYPEMNANITMKDISNNGINEPNDYKYKFEIKSVDHYRGFNKSLNYILNIFSEKLQQKDSTFDKFYVKIKKKNTEYPFLNESELLLDKNIKIINSDTTFEKGNAIITIDRLEGIEISSKSKGEFIQAVNFLKEILVS